MTVVQAMQKQNQAYQHQINQLKITHLLAEPNSPVKVVFVNVNRTK